MKLGSEPNGRCKNLQVNAWTRDHLCSKNGFELRGVGYLPEVRSSRSSNLDIEGNGVVVGINDRVIGRATRIDVN